jgi:O-acetyl-ADP-ribose deacetylase (regulator of RNase III)
MQGKDAELLVSLCAIEPGLVDAWKRAFQGIAGVDIRDGDILGRRADAIVSPANSFGYMDGGIDLAYRDFFGMQLETRLREQIGANYDGELPVGLATVIETGDESMPFLIAAPTMRVPENVSDTANAYLAFRAALLAVRAHNAGAGKQIRSVLSPGMATGVGAMDHGRAARQMAAAYLAAMHRVRPAGPSEIWDQHRQLLR